ncbi:MAG: chloride channel protein [Chloroflexi bacterium]|nr:chloride channel protein [Chloroflexota bacterium]
MASTFVFSDAMLGVTLALVVGVASGLAAVVFRWMIDLSQTSFFRVVGGSFDWPSGLGIALLPALGGLAVGAISHWFAEYKGASVPGLLRALAVGGGRIKPLSVVAAAVASATTIGSGGSAGREGPIIYIASGIGSAVGQWLSVSRERLTLLTACGAAGGIAATFNTPIAGVFFSLEIVLGEFSTRSFSLVVLSSVAASVVMRILVGANPSFSVPAYELVSPVELPLYALLGLLSAFVAVAFTWVFYLSGDLFARWQFPALMKPVVGGLIVGLIGVFFPQVFGVGYDIMELSMQGQLALSLLVILLFAKLFATCITLGSGGWGGVFGPSLFLGAMLGGSFGAVSHSLFPTVTASEGAYALVGMGAVMASVTHTPIYSVLMLFEMTNNYLIILPLMVATVISTVFARLLLRDSIFTLGLRRQGIEVGRRNEGDVMSSVTVAEAMTREFEVLPKSMPLSEMAERVISAREHAFPVVDNEGNLWGIVSLQDLQENLENQDKLRVEDVATTRLLVAYPDETVSEALRRFGSKDVGRLPVVERQDPSKLLGVLRRRDVVAAYVRHSKAKAERAAESERLKLESMTGTNVIEVVVDLGSPLVGKKVKELSLPRECVLVSVLRGSETVIPRGDTLLRRGDRIVVLTTQSAESEVLSCLSA